MDKYVRVSIYTYMAQLLADTTTFLCLPVRVEASIYSCILCRSEKANYALVSTPRNGGRQAFANNKDLLSYYYDPS